MREILSVIGVVFSLCAAIYSIKTAKRVDKFISQMREDDEKCAYSLFPSMKTQFFFDQTFYALENLIH